MSTTIEQMPPDPATVQAATTPKTRRRRKAPAGPSPSTESTGASSGRRRGRPENLRPFKPGQSGNPGGRPAGFAAKIREATKEGKDLIAVAVSILRDEESKERMAAVKWLADRGWGKEPLELTLNEGIRIKLVRPA